MNLSKANHFCITAIFLTRNDDARRITENYIDQETALNFGLKRWMSIRSSRASLFILPEAIESPWRGQIVSTLKKHQVQCIFARENNPLTYLLEVMHDLKITWASIIPATSPFMDGKLIDTSLRFVNNDTHGYDYIYGADFPKGLRPLIVHQNLLKLCTSSDAYSDYSNMRKDIFDYLVESLPFFRGLKLSSPDKRLTPDLDISLASEDHTADLIPAVQFIISQGQPLTNSSLAQLVRDSQRRKMEAAFRVARLRPMPKKLVSTRPKSIFCLSCRSEKISGGDTSLVNLLQEIDPYRFTPFLATPFISGTLIDELKRLGIKVIADPLLEIHKEDSVSELLYAATRLSKFAYINNIDLVYANNTGASLLSAICALILGLPLVVRIIDYISINVLDRNLITLANRIIVPSNDVALHYASLGIPQTRIRVVHEGVKDSWLSPVQKSKDLKQLFGFPENSYLIGVVGRLDDPRKAISQAISTVAKVVKVRPDVRMVVCGKTSIGGALQQQQLINLINSLGLEDIVKLAGYFPDMRSIYPQFDLLLHPAFREPFGLVLTEAMATGIPLIAVKSGGVPEQVIDGVTGLLVERSDSDLFFQKVMLLLDNPSLGNLIGLQAREHVRNHFTSKRFASNIEEVFDEIIFDK